MAVRGLPPDWLQTWLPEALGLTMSPVIMVTMLPLRFSSSTGKAV